MGCGCCGHRYTAIPGGPRLVTRTPRVGRYRVPRPVTTTTTTTQPQPTPEPSPVVESTATPSAVEPSKDG